MYDIKIFLEDDGKMGAKVSAGKEMIYAVGNTHTELMADLKKGLELCFQGKNTDSKTTRLYHYLNDVNGELACR